MSINSTLKKEGIRVIRQLNTLEINKIASNISEKICATFPEHQIEQRDLFIAIARLNMYVADMPNDLDVAKYFYKNNSIYFSRNLNLSDLNTLAIHECLHFMQELKDRNGKLLRLGLYNIKDSRNIGISINEAAVQLMASLSTDSQLDSVKYYNMDFDTTSPDYYPIQTALLKEMMYFTDSYPLFHSTLYSNDVFKNTFIAKSSEKTYDSIEYNFDLILRYEELLSQTAQELDFSAEYDNSIPKLKSLHSKFNSLKTSILEKTIETQNIIINDCFNAEYNTIKTLDDIKEFQNRLYSFKNVLIHSDNNNFYNQFYCDMMSALESKQEFIEKNGPIVLDVQEELSLTVEFKFGLNFIKTFYRKFKLLVEERIRAKEL